MAKNSFSSRFNNWLNSSDEIIKPDFAPYEKKEPKTQKPLHIKALDKLPDFEVRVFKKIYAGLSVLLCVCLIAVLLETVSFLPDNDSPDAPTNNEVSERYIEKGVEETGAINMVTGMILDYRAFDTLGESHVLFAGMSAVFILIMDDKKNFGIKSTVPEAEYDTTKDMIVVKTATVIVPAALLYGIYVILNGHLSPGGGFSGGTIIGAALILYSMAFGFEKAEKFVNKKTLRGVTLASLAFYSLSKCYSFFTGANELPSIISSGIPGRIISAGLILPLNIAVGLVVACTMYGLYSVFRRGRI